MEIWSIDGASRFIFSFWGLGFRVLGFSFLGFGFKAGVTGNSVARKFCRRETESPKEKVSLSVNYVAKRHSYS